MCIFCGVADVWHLSVCIGDCWWGLQREGVPTWSLTLFLSSFSSFCPFELNPGAKKQGEFLLRVLDLEIHKAGFLETSAGPTRDKGQGRCLEPLSQGLQSCQEVSNSLSRGSASQHSLLQVGFKTRPGLSTQISSPPCLLYQGLNSYPSLSNSPIFPYTFWPRLSTCLDTPVLPTLKELFTLLAQVATLCLVGS